MKFVFVGNRYQVLEKMINLKCEIVAIYVVKNSYLEMELKKKKITYFLIEDKESLIKNIESNVFDCLVSNGCPYIFPISKMKKENQFFINIHPSLLPDLKGKHPINGALLYNRKHGVTCHHMDDGIDTGNIISNIEIPLEPYIDLNLLYKISFKAEALVFELALEKNFKKLNNISNCDKPIYYTRNSKDSMITCEDSLENIVRKIRAFGIPSLYARFIRNNIEYKIKSAYIFQNSLLESMSENMDNKIIFIYENNAIVKYRSYFINFSLLDIKELHETERFFSFDIKGIKE